MTGLLYFALASLLMVTKVDSEDEWIEFQGNEYLFSEDTSDWAGANTACTNMPESSLASILSYAESMFINEMLQEIGSNTDHWIGLRHESMGCDACDGQQQRNNSICSSDRGQCCDCRSQWKWTDSSDMSFMNWMYTEPTGPGNPCGRISRASSTHPVTEGMYWFDYICATESRFICKRTKGSDDIPTGNGSNENTSAGVSNKKNNNGSNGDMVIGVSVALGLVLLAVVAVVVFVVLRRRRQNNNTKEKNYTEEHVYYNESKLDPAPTYVNHVAVEDDTRNEDNTSDIPTDDTPGTTYAEVILPAAKPKPLKPKPVQNKVLQYAELDLSPSGTQPNFNQYGAQGEYSSVDSLKQVRTLSYEGNDGGYAGMENDTNTTADTPHNPNVLKPQPQLTEDELQAMYAQPMKKNKGDRSPQVMHRPAPNDTGVLYAVPMK